MLKLLKRVRRDEDGATAIEYGLLAALIAVGAIASFESFGSSLVNMWTTTSDTSQDVMNRS